MTADLSRSCLALNRVGSLDCELYRSLDWDLWLRIWVYFPTIHVQQVWARIRTWDGTKTVRIGHLAGAEHVQSVKNLFKNHPSPLLSASIRRTALASAYRMEAVGRYSQADYPGSGKSLMKSLWVDPSRMSKGVRKLLQFLVFHPRVGQLLDSLKRTVLLRK